MQLERSIRISTDIVVDSVYFENLIGAITDALRNIWTARMILGDGRLVYSTQPKLFFRQLIRLAQELTIPILLSHICLPNHLHSRGEP
jgi:hypothetical protein